MRRFLSSVLALAFVGALAGPAVAQVTIPLPSPSPLPAPADPAVVKAACDALPVVARTLCQATAGSPSDPFGQVIKGVIGGRLSDMFNEATRIVAAWAADRIGSLYTMVREHTSPDLSAEWFREFYGKLFFIATLLLTMVMFVGMLVGAARGSGAAIGEAILGSAVALALMFAIPSVLKVVLEVVDWLSSGILAAAGSSGEELMLKMSTSLEQVSLGGVGPTVNVLAALLGTILALVGALVLWITLTLRNWLLLMAVATGVLMLLLRGTGGKTWTSRLLSFQGILICMPIPIAIGMAMALHALGDIGDVGVGTDEITAAGMSLVVSGLLPWKLFKYMPYLGMMAMAAMHPNPRVGHRAMAGAHFVGGRLRNWSTTAAAKGTPAAPVMAGAAAFGGGKAQPKAERPPQNVVFNVLNYSGQPTASPFRQPARTVYHQGPGAAPTQALNRPARELGKGSDDGKQGRPIQPD